MHVMYVFKKKVKLDEQNIREIEIASLIPGRLKVIIIASHHVASVGKVLNSNYSCKNNIQRAMERFSKN